MAIPMADSVTMKAAKVVAEVEQNIKQTRVHLERGNQHTTMVIIEQKGSKERHVATCLCGWRGNQHKYWMQANTEQRKHEREMEGFI